MTANPTRQIYRVAIRHNIVTSMTVEPIREGLDVHTDPLAVSTIVAQRMRQLGCIDGDYCFGDLPMARDFAGLAMDFASKIVTKSAEALAKAEFNPNGWSNPFVPKG